MTIKSRCMLFSSLTIACFVCCAAVHVVRAEDVKPESDRSEIKLTDTAIKLHKSALMIDGHNDMPWEIRTKGSSSFDKIDISKPQSKLQTDIPRLRQGGVGAQFWS